MTGPSSATRRLTLRTSSVVALLLALLATAVASWAIRSLIREQEAKLLKERTGEVALLLTQAVNAIPATLREQGGILQATNGSRDAYQRAASTQVAADGGRATFAWLRAEPGGGFRVLAAAGPGLQAGQLVTDIRAQTFAAATRTSQLVPTPVFGTERKLGFALGPPAAPSGTVLYQEATLGPVSAPQQASSQPFSELNVVLYDGPRPQPTRVLASTTPHFPLHGDALNQSLPVGASTWLLSTQARQPLVGSVAATAPWAALGAGIVGSLLIAAMMEAAARRRDAALALYASEHQMAETLQRNLLPELPSLPGLDLAARYLAGGQGQQVGGDWFDAFPLADGRVGLAVGDVIGHDLVAATAMAQVRAALRAYAVDEYLPGEVIDRLDHFVGAFRLTQLVSVFYALLDPPGADGSRLLRYCNAGHLPPLVRGPDGQVRSLASPESVVIGAPVAVEHGQAEHRLERGSTLLLFTDGLVERPAASLDEGLAELATTLAAGPPADPDGLCDRLLDAASEHPLRDDIAVLVVQLPTTAEPAPTPPQARRPVANNQPQSGRLHSRRNR